ncbi:MAG: hypothetical protein K2P27_08780, partial [Lachnospiraceae bacterium]|nr:hypothetical protein [Lachnospiraceae bacterium]
HSSFAAPILNPVSAGKASSLYASDLSSAFALFLAYLEYTTKKGLYTQPFEKINILFTILRFLYQQYRYDPYL